MPVREEGNALCTVWLERKSSPCGGAVCPSALRG